MSVVVINYVFITFLMSGNGCYNVSKSSMP